MEREIKFRAWDEIEKQMYHFVEITSYKDGSVGIQIGNNYSDLHFHKKIIVQQYTGLKDKNGIDIYEGDILKVKIVFPEGYETWQVVFWRGTFSGTEIGRDGLDGEYLWDVNLASEIIGNIYENAALLKP